MWDTTQWGDMCGFHYQRSGDQLNDSLFKIRTTEHTRIILLEIGN